MSITGEEAFDAYEAVRGRLPPVVPMKTMPRRVKNLAEIADEFDVFFLDAFGVLNIGETAIPGVPERVAALQDAGKRVVVVSNAAGFPHDNLMEKYERLGYKFAPNDVVTSRKALAQRVGDGEGCRWGLMVSDDVPAAEFETLNHVRLQDDAAAYDDCDAVLMIGAATWTENRQALLEKSLERRPRKVLVGNPDIVAPRETCFSREPGHFAHRLADNTGVMPEFFGKPFPGIFELAFKRVGEVDRSRVLMVGDSIHTDVLGARSVGVASALVTGFGFFAGMDVEHSIKRSGIAPDYLLNSP